MSKTHALGGEPKILSLDEVFARSKPEVQVVSIPSLGGAIKLRPMTMDEVRQLRKDSTRGKGEDAEMDPDLFYKEAMVLTFEEPTVTRAQADALYTHKAQTVAAFIKAIDELNGFGPDAEAKAEAEFRQ